MACILAAIFFVLGLFTLLVKDFGEPKPFTDIDLRKL